jgi:transglutaminase/protease-like cytokinesis protein 3
MKIYRYLIFACFTLLCGQFTFAQNYSPIDHIVLKYPNLGSTEKVAERIQKDFASDYDKARAIYSWIALNIKYDYALFLNPPQQRGFSYSSEAEKQKKLRDLNNQLIQKTFKSRKGVCEGFTALFQHLAGLLNLQCEIVTGDSKIGLNDIGRKRIISNHAWNIVLLDKKWRLIDVTWAQGYYNNNMRKMVSHFTPIYFDTSPDYFFAKHYPESGNFNGEKINQDDFLNGPLIYNTTIEKDYKVISPDSGTIHAKSGEKIRFTIKNLSRKDQIFHLNKSNRPVEISNSRKKNGRLEFEIICDQNLGEYLTIFVNTDSVVSFKINKK